MTGAEMILLLAGFVFMVGSFFITEKLSPSELNKIAELSEAELKKIIEREVLNAGGKIEDAIDNQLESSMDKVDCALEKETNEKIMAISEYSDTVLESMNKTHNEIMFLYSMLNDKHTELTGMVSDLQRMAADVRGLEESIQVKKEALAAEQEKAERAKRAAAETAGKQILTAEVKNLRGNAAKTSSAAGNAAKERNEKQGKTENNKTGNAVETNVKQAPESGSENHNQAILKCYQDGMTEVEIAKKLELGVGEVRLVLGLYRGAGA